MTTSAVNSISNFMSDISTQEIKKVKINGETELRNTVKSPDTFETKSENNDLLRVINDKVALQNAETAVNKSLLSYFNEKISFSIDDKTQKTVIKIIDKKTEEVVKQYPAQEFLDMVHALNKAAKIVLKDLPKYM
jgi:uncharacterized FlaG/YvyC family protein